MNKKRGLVNPFLFLLAKRMLDYEFVRMGKSPSDLKIAEYIYNRHKRKKYEDTKFSNSPGVRDSIAFSKAERIRKFVLSPKDFMISEEMLNYLIAELSILFRGDSWNDFIEFYNNGTYATIGKLHLRVIEQRRKGVSPNEIYEKLVMDDHPLIDRFNLQNDSFDEKDYNQYLAYANDVLFRIHSNYVADDWENRPIILIRTGDPLVIARSANANEIKLLEQKSKRDYKYPLPFLKDLINWHLKNKDVYFYFLNKDRLILGGCALVPLHENAYYNLQKGKVEKHEITKDEILLSHETSKIKYILFEFLFSNDRWGYSSKFEEIFRTLLTKYASHFSYEQITLGAIPTSKYEVAFLKKQGFTGLGKARYSTGNSETFIFYELLWADPDPF